MGMNCQPGPETAALGAWKLRSRAEPQLSCLYCRCHSRRVWGSEELPARGTARWR